MSDEMIARGIIERERDMGISNRLIMRLAGGDCFTKKFNPITNQGSAVTTAEVFSNMGVTLQPGDTGRKSKMRRFSDRLQIFKDGTRPMLVVYPGCEHFIRTIPLLMPKERDPEDIDDGPSSEDHVYDEACHICQDRPFYFDYSKHADKGKEVRDNGIYSAYRYGDYDSETGELEHFFAEM
jgi:hypothetical protein